MTSDWGPLAALAGNWEGDQGIDIAYSHLHERVTHTPYRERATFAPFGPIYNGKQRLFGLDYRTSMWRGDETIPFHAEVGYWLWDPDSHEILRAFVVPRGISVLAGGTATHDDTTFTLAAERGDSAYAISENHYLSKRASSHTYHATVTTCPAEANTWSYLEVTTLQMEEMARPFAHSDQNTLHRAD